MPIVAGRDFNEGDKNGSENVVIVSASLAQQLFPGQDPLNRHLMWTDGVMKFIGVTLDSRRIVGVTADVDDERIDPRTVMTVYHPFEQELSGGRLFVHTRSDPYALVPTITKIVREMAADQVVERAATLEDVRAEVLSPERVNAFVFSAFAGIALLIAVVGVAGVLAFLVSARTREFGVRLAVGATRRHLLVHVLSQGGLIAVVGIAAGAAASYVLASISASWFETVRLPGAFPTLGAAAVLIGAAITASVMPAARASRVDVVQALRSE
jgi:hypothetical protein